MFAGACIAAGFLGDDRWMSKSEARETITAVKGEVTKAIRETKVEILAWREADLKDLIFQIEATPEAQKTQVDRAMLSRYKAQLLEMQGRLAERGPSR